MRRRHTAEAGRGPRRRKWQELRQQPRRGIFLLPSLLTTGNLFCGFLAVVLASQSRFTEAAISLFVAMVMDMLDGKVARLTKTTTQFGVEFDSLADVVSFGVAPAFMLYSFALAPLGRAAWLGAFLFAICGALRLARFNVYAGVTDRRYFVGLPIPAAAAMVAAIIFAAGSEPVVWWPFAVAWIVLLMALALLMISSWRYRSFKDFNLLRPRSTLSIIVLGSTIYLIWNYPQPVLLGLAVLYVGGGIVVRFAGVLRRRFRPSHPHPERQVG